MGKVPTASVEMTRKKKKGRPLKNPLPLSTPVKPSYSNSTRRRSARRNPNHSTSPPLPEFDDDDERKEKKVKLVVRLPQSDEKSKVAAEKYEDQYGGRDFDSGSGSESDVESEDREDSAKKRKIDGVDRGSENGVSDQDKEDVKATESAPHGSPLESGPTTPLPDKKILVFILDRLQKKDTYGVFSEPVDPNELPDYFDIIEKPMDFGTVRKKLETGAYKNLEELEADVFLICSNAMQYNASDTVYYRQARTIQELARRDFKNLKHEGEDGEIQPKVVRRGRPPSSKNQKKALETSPAADRVDSELSSGATLANGGEDKATGSNSYNLRKASTLFRWRPTDPFVSTYGSRNGENYSELSADWNHEFPVSILRADMKYGKKLLEVDENRRDTYRQFHLQSNSPIGNMKRLVPVGLHEAFGYARSLARYAANLGPIAWKTASKKIDAVLPTGVQYGPGWVNDSPPPPPQPLPFSSEKQKPSNNTASVCNSSEPVTALANGPTSEGELARKSDDASSWRNHIPAQQRYDNSNNINNNNNNSNRNNSVPPDLNVRVVQAGSPGSSSLQIGSPQQPDLALQL